MLGQPVSTGAHRIAPKKINQQRDPHPRDAKEGNGGSPTPDLLGVPTEVAAGDWRRTAGAPPERLGPPLWAQLVCSGSCYIGMDSRWAGLPVS
ncbi:hypothetical protein BHE74_00042073 [Ensete ventricosum]|nr:hypothetical protein BHE74_00042073 [Ensete ventricosum]